VNDHAPKRKARSIWTAEHDAAVQRLTAAAKHANASNEHNDRVALTEAVHLARHAGVGWTKIGDVLGIASGNAYQRYRKHVGCSAGKSDH
jgi:hypothetical protein